MFSHLTKKLLRKLVEVAKESGEDYNAFWEDMGHIIKEGIPDDEKRRKELVNLIFLQLFMVL